MLTTAGHSANQKQPSASITAFDEHNLKVIALKEKLARDSEFTDIIKAWDKGSPEGLRSGF